jgi:hypothetical protein
MVIMNHQINEVKEYIMSKQYTVISTRRNHGREDGVSEETGTMEELVGYFKYTLECGDSWSHESGNSKINTNPKTGPTLIKNLNNAARNSAANGDARESFELRNFT